MKSQLGPISGYIVAFIWTIFMGVTAVSIGVGAIYPPLNLVAKPFVCPNGNMVFQESTSNPLPGTTYTQIGWYCVDNQAEKTTELDIFQVALPAGVIYGLVLYVVGLAVWLFLQRRRAAPPGSTWTSPTRRTAATGHVSPDRRPAHPTPAGGHARARMQELDELRAANMISEAEYQQKRADILKDL